MTSQTWEKIVNKIQDFRGDHSVSLRSWIYKIARNTLLDFYKNSSKNQILNLKALEIWEIEHPEDEKENPLLAFIDQKDQIQKIRQEIDQLPAKQRSSVLLKYFDGLKNKEISKVLEISEKTVASNLSRALQQIKKKLKED